MGSAPYIGLRLGGGPILKVSVSQLDAKERPGKVPMGSSWLLLISAITVINQEQGQPAIGPILQRMP